MDKQRQEPIHSAYEIREKHKRIPSPPSPQQAFPASGELHATLAISELEAQGGTSRSIRLPGGRQTIVVVPVGAYEGQVISLEGLGEPAFPGGPRGTLTLTLTIIPAKETAPGDRKSTRLNSSHSQISYAVFCLKKKKQNDDISSITNAYICAHTISVKNNLHCLPTSFQEPRRFHHTYSRILCVSWRLVNRRILL